LTWQCSAKRDHTDTPNHGQMALAVFGLNSTSRLQNIQY
jgi:hypothetical protein